MSIKRCERKVNRQVKKLAKVLDVFDVINDKTKELLKVSKETKKELEDTHEGELQSLENKQRYESSEIEDTISKAERTLKRLKKFL